MKKEQEKPRDGGARLIGLGKEILLPRRTPIHEFCHPIVKAPRIVIRRVVEIRVRYYQQMKQRS